LHSCFATDCEKDFDEITLQFQLDHAEEAGTASAFWTAARIVEQVQESWRETARGIGGRSG
jgi:hypothetical protein